MSDTIYIIAALFLPIGFGAWFAIEAFKTDPPTGMRQREQ